MNTKKIGLVAAISKNRVLGKDNKLIWTIPDDQKRFRAITSGNPVIMGRKTYESIGKPLPNRTNIIITRDTSYTAEGCIITHSIEEALAAANSADGQEIFVIGGGEIYTAALPYADKLYLTIIDQEAEGDAFFPPYEQFTTITFKKNKEYNGIHYSFIDLQKPHA